MCGIVCGSLCPRFDRHHRVSSVVLAKAAREHPGQPLGERARIRRAIAVEHARLVEQQARGVFLERALVLAQRGKRDDELVPRIDLQDRLRHAIVSRPAPARSFSSWRSGPNSGATRQTALSVSRSEARTSATSSPSVSLMKVRKFVTASSVSGAGSGLASTRGISARSAAPCVTDLNGLPSNASAGRDPEAVDRIGQQQHLDAAGAESFQMRRGLEAVDVVAREVVDRGLVLLERADIVLQAPPAHRRTAVVLKRARASSASRRSKSS